MELGRFSVSLAVKDIAASKAFYEALGFEKLDGNVDENWLILGLGDAKIGLFQGMFEKNILTFNPAELDSIKEGLAAAGITPVDDVDDPETGFAYLTLQDPDGNQILIDRLLA